MLTTNRARATCSLLRWLLHAFFLGVDGRSSVHPRMWFNFLERGSIGRGTSRWTLAALSGWPRGPANPYRSQRLPHYEGLALARHARCRRTRGRQSAFADRLSQIRLRGPLANSFPTHRGASTCGCTHVASRCVLKFSIHRFARDALLLDGLCIALPLMACGHWSLRYLSWAFALSRHLVFSFSLDSRALLPGGSGLLSSHCRIRGN